MSGFRMYIQSQIVGNLPVLPGNLVKKPRQLSYQNTTVFYLAYQMSKEEGLYIAPYKGQSLQYRLNSCGLYLMTESLTACCVWHSQKPLPGLL